MSDVPPDLHYTPEHEWVRTTGTDTVRVGITDFAQSALGDVVFVQLPDLDSEVAAGASFGEVESTKSVSEIYAPISGVITARNDGLVDQPDLINTDPYGEGWLVEMEPADQESVTALLDAAGYRSLTEG